MPKIIDPNDLASNLTKREHFAGLILAGLKKDFEEETCEEMADTAVDLADALIKRLKK